MFHVFATLVVRMLLRLLTSYRVEGMERFPSRGPVLLVANHSNLIDPPILGALLPRHIRFMAKIELFRLPVVGWIVRHYDAFPVRRGDADRQAFEWALQVLARGEVLGMFPEGTRSKTGGLQAGQLGVAVLALRSGAPVVPVGISGSHRVLRFPNILCRPAIKMTIGQPYRLVLPGATGSRRDFVLQATDDMMRRLAQLLPPEQRGIYAGTVPSSGGEDAVRIA